MAKLERPEPEEPLPDSFKQGNLKIKRISVFGLKNKEFMGLAKGDPYTKLKVVDYKKQTKALNNAGDVAVWDFLDYETLVTEKNVRVDDIELEVWDSNTFKDKLLGTHS